MSQHRLIEDCWGVLKQEANKGAPESDTHFNSCSTEGEREDISSRKKLVSQKEEEN